MSSPLPAAVLAEFDARWRLKDGRYRCAGCGGKFAKTHIHRDHIKPEAEHPHLRDDPANLQPLCAPPGGGGCHRRKTSKEARARAKARAPRASLAARLVALVVGVALLQAGVYAVGWAYFEIQGADPAAWRDLVADIVTWTWVTAAGLGFIAAWYRFGGDGSERTTTGPANAEAARLEARIVAEAREVLGPRGEVKVTNTEWSAR